MVLHLQGLKKALLSDGIIPGYSSQRSAAGRSQSTSVKQAPSIADDSYIQEDDEVSSWLEP